MDYEEEPYFAEQYASEMPDEALEAEMYIDFSKKEIENKASKPKYKKVQQWLSQLSLEERQHVFTETCPDFTWLLLEILRRHNDYKGRTLISTVTKADSVSVGVLQLDQIEKKNIRTGHETFMYSAVRLFSKNTHMDSITVSHKFVESVDYLIECFSIFSERKSLQPIIHTAAASKQPEYHKATKMPSHSSSQAKNKHGQSNIYNNFPSWFKPSDGGTIYEWISAYFEQIMFTKFNNSSNKSYKDKPEAFKECKQYEDFWKDLKSREKIKVLEEFKSTKSTLHLAPHPVISAAVRSISHPFIEEVHPANLEKCKEFMLYAAAYSNPNIFVDSIYFMKLELACKQIAECCHNFLLCIKKSYGNSVAKKLMEEEDEECKKETKQVSKKGKQQKEKANKKENDEKIKETTENNNEDEDIENYLPDKWEIIREMEYYKYFFDHDNLNDALVVSLAPTFEKKKTKKKKNKKHRVAAALQAETVYGSIETTVPAVEETKSESVQLNADLALTTDSDVAKNSSENKTKTAVKGEDETEEHNEQASNKVSITKEIKIEHKDNNKKEELKKDVIIVEIKPVIKDDKKEDENKEDEKMEDEKKKESKEKLPEQNVEDEKSIQSSSVNEAKISVEAKEEKKASKKAKKKQDAQTKESIKEYKEFTASVIKMYASKTGISSTKQKKSPKKKKNKGKEPANNTNEANETEIPRRSNTPKKEVSKKIGEKASMTPQREKLTGIILNNEETKALYNDISRDNHETTSTYYHKKKNKSEYYEETEDPQGYYEPDIAESEVSPLMVYVPFYFDSQTEILVNNLNIEMASIIAEMKAYNASISPVCEYIRQFVQSEAAKLFDPNIEAVLYGSMALGLALDESDIDIALRQLHEPTTEAYLAELQRFGEVMCSLPSVIKCKVIPTARVPVIKLEIDLPKLGIKFNKTKIKVDITIEDEKHSPSVKNGIQFTDWVKQKVKDVPVIEPLTFLFKQLLHSHGLNISYYGGLCSYTLILMLSAFLNTCPVLTTPGHYFLEALRYYGYEFKCDHMKIMQGEFIHYIMEEQYRDYQDELVVFDLFIPTMNTAAKVTQFRQIKELFGATYDLIYKSTNQSSILKHTLIGEDCTNIGNNSK